VLSAILVGPPRDWFTDPGAPLRRITLPQEVRRSLKTQQHAHSSAEPRPRDVSRFDTVARTFPSGSISNGGPELTPSCAPEPSVYIGLRSTGLADGFKAVPPGLVPAVP